MDVEYSTIAYLSYAYELTSMICVIDGDMRLNNAPYWCPNTNNQKCTW